MFRNFINDLQEKLRQKDLPGKDAQLEMAPRGRDFSFPKSSGIKAGVMILLYPGEKDVYFALTRRHDYNGPHSGQISLPGGKQDSGDRDIIDTALRETQEEIGVNPKSVKVLGLLTPLWIPVSGYEVHPVVSVSYEVPECQPEPLEVKYILDASVKNLLRPENLRIQIMHIAGKDWEVPYFSIKGEVVWGATAMILSEFKTLCQPIFLQHYP